MRNVSRTAHGCVACDIFCFSIRFSARVAKLWSMLAYASAHKSSLVSWKACLAWSYSFERLVLNTPLSSVQSTTGWPAGIAKHREAQPSGPVSANMTCITGTCGVQFREVMVSETRHTLSHNVGRKAQLDWDACNADVHRRQSWGTNGRGLTADMVKP